ncbi:hypothetical protein XAB3213_270045 [Xanthomonas citri pv. bilvae]|nr:hypothetical protein XAB3213_270045 [Xanthomonas citri pv. bilvae]
MFDYIERRHNPRMRRRAAKQDQKVCSSFTTVRDIGVEPALTDVLFDLARRRKDLRSCQLHFLSCVHVSGVERSGFLKAGNQSALESPDMLLERLHFRKRDVLPGCLSSAGQEDRLTGWLPVFSSVIGYRSGCAAPKQALIC